MVDFFPKPLNKIITAKEAIKHLENKYIEDRPEYKKLKFGERPYTYAISEYRIYPNKPIQTIRKAGGTLGGNTNIHYFENRNLTVQELKILCSFPENWILPGKTRQQVDRLGNSVMPKFMQAIAKHLKDLIMIKEPTVISLFCGTGGSSLGYKWAGYKELLAIDFDSHATECFKLNFPEVPCWNRSVFDVLYQEILDFCNIRNGELDVLDGSPPCQGFSTAGKRNVNDSRNDLFKRYVYFIEGLKPKVFIMENVPGMAKGKMKGMFIEIMKTLKETGYIVKCKKMNSMYYGVPQSRERLIFIGVRPDIFEKL